MRETTSSSPITVTLLSLKKPQRSPNLHVAARNTSTWFTWHDRLYLSLPTSRLFRGNFTSASFFWSPLSVCTNLFSWTVRICGIFVSSTLFTAVARWRHWSHSTSSIDSSLSKSEKHSSMSTTSPGAISSWTSAKIWVLTKRQEFLGIERLHSNSSWHRDWRFRLSIRLIIQSSIHRELHCSSGCCEAVACATTWARLAASYCPDSDSTPLRFFLNVKLLVVINLFLQCLILLLLVSVLVDDPVQERCVISSFNVPVVAKLNSAGSLPRLSHRMRMMRGRILHRRDVPLWPRHGAYSGCAALWLYLLPWASPRSFSSPPCCDLLAAARWTSSRHLGSWSVL